MKNSYPEIEEKMKKTLSVLEYDFSVIRAGRANPAVLDKVRVNYYGTETPLNQMAAISVPEARMLVIQPWDASSIKAIEKAINESDIGINPNNDGKTIRLIFPPLTEERRKDLIKQVKDLSEKSKVSIRSIRRDNIEKFKAQKKNSEITEDDLKIIEKDVQELTDKYIKLIEDTEAAKEKELMSV